MKSTAEAAIFILKFVLKIRKYYIFCAISLWTTILFNTNFNAEDNASVCIAISA